ARFDPLRVAEHDATSLRHRHRAAASRSLDEALADEGLERAHVIADRRQRAVQLLRRGPERPRVGDGAKCPQMLDLDALPIVRHSDILRGKQMLLRRFNTGRLRSWRL